MRDFNENTATAAVISFVRLAGDRRSRASRPNMSAPHPASITAIERALT